MKDAGVSEQRSSLVFHPVWTKGLEGHILDVPSGVFVGQGCMGTGLNYKGNVRNRNMSPQGFQQHSLEVPPFGVCVWSKVKRTAGRGRSGEGC